MEMKPNVHESSDFKYLLDVCILLMLKTHQVEQGWPTSLWSFNFWSVVAGKPYFYLFDVLRSIFYP